MSESEPVNPDEPEVDATESEALEGEGVEEGGARGALEEDDDEGEDLVDADSDDLV